MAITVDQTPYLYSPIYNEATIRLSSDNVAQTNFRIRVEMYIDYTLLSDGTLIYEGDFYPRPDDSIIIDTHRIYETYVEQSLIEDYVIPNYGKQAQGGIDLRNVRVRVTEQYGDPLADDDTTDVDFFVYNGALKYQTFVDYDYTEYIPALNDDTKKFLTNSPSAITIGESQQYQLSWLQEDDNGVDIIVDEIEVKVYTSAAVLQKTFTIAAGSVDSLGSDFSNFFRSCLVGTADLPNTTFTSGVLPVFDTSSAYYTVQLKDDNGDPSSELKRFNIVEHCETPMTLTWLNRLGGFDAYTFGLRHKKGSNVDRERTNRTGYLYDTPLTNLQKESGRITYNITTQDKIKVVCNWLKDEELVWLEELITSPEIFLYINDKWNSVLITNYTDFQLRTQAQDGTFNLELELEFAYSSSSQRA